MSTPDCPQDWSVCPNCTIGDVQVRHCMILKRGDINPVNGLLFMGGRTFKKPTWFRRLKCWYDNWECGI